MTSERSKEVLCLSPEGHFSYMLACEAPPERGPLQVCRPLVPNADVISELCSRAFRGHLPALQRPSLPKLTKPLQKAAFETLQRRVTHEVLRCAEMRSTGAGLLDLIRRTLHTEVEQFVHNELLGKWVQRNERRTARRMRKLLASR